MRILIRGKMGLDMRFFVLSLFPFGASTALGEAMSITACAHNKPVLYCYNLYTVGNASVFVYSALMWSVNLKLRQ